MIAGHPGPQGTRAPMLQSNEKGDPSFVEGIVAANQVISLLTGSKTVSDFVSKFGKMFIVPTLHERREGVSFHDALRMKGGLVGWMARAPLVTAFAEHIEVALNKGVLTPEMIIELIENPKLAAEILPLLREM